MPTDVRRAVVLLGAGASAAAGIPTSATLATQLLRTLENSEPDAYRILEFVVQRLSSPGSEAHYVLSPDIELIMSTLEGLAFRRDFLYERFVVQWDQTIQELEQLAPHAPESAPGLAFLRTYEQLRWRIPELLAVADPDRCEYLTPLLACSGTHAELTIATLNYDLTLETAAAAAGVEVSTGVEGWRQSGFASFPEGRIPLLKLHGSVDWPQFGDAPGVKLGYTAARPLREPADVGGSPRSSLPAMIMGQGNKLTTVGPFIDLLSHFNRSLQEADRLLVVGYSFRDPHVNELLRRWVNRHDGPMMVLDPFFPAAPDAPHWGPDFRTSLFTLFDQLIVVRAPAEEALAGAMNDLLSLGAGH